jgi:hypothetical protein
MSETRSGPRTIVATVAALPSSAGERFGERTAARHKVDGEWREVTYADAVTAIQEVALGLVELGATGSRRRVGSSSPSTPPIHRRNAPGCSATPAPRW